MLLVGADPVFALHDTGRGHPERPARLDAVRAGIDDAALGDAVVPIEPREATIAELTRVHPVEHLERLQQRAARGGGAIDADTVMCPESWRVATLAAGTGLAAVDALRRGQGDAAFLALRPPGHHATDTVSMGFCLLNNVAVVAAALSARGERVMIVDYDAHHGNGTQDIFYGDSSVLYVSFHEWPLYPGTGRHDEIGRGDGEGCTLNFPLPAGTTGDVYLRGLDDVVGPVAARFQPDWVLISAGFDAHRDDPLTGLALSAGDYAAMTARIVEMVPPGRVVAFLEGGYDLHALRTSTAASLPTLIGSAPGHLPEPQTSGGPGRAVVDAVADLWGVAHL